MTNQVILLYYFAMCKKQPFENVDHETAARPFSIHHTFVGLDNTNALYLHCHPEAEFFYLEKGTLSFYVENEEYELNSGDAIFIPPYLTHNAEKSAYKTCRYSALVFSLEWLSGYAGGEGSLYVNTIRESRIGSVMVYRHNRSGDKGVLKRIAHFKGYASQPIQHYELRLIGELLINIQKIYNTLSEKTKYEEKTDTSREGIQKGIDHLLAHFNERITLAELAEVSGYSESHFCHRFKTLTGYAPFVFLNRIRVIKATEQLIVSDDKITKIAADCGFENISYFNRVFRSQIKMSPGEYRKRGRQNNIKDTIQP